jgi:hypothetical protein
LRVFDIAQAFFDLHADSVSLPPEMRSKPSEAAAGFTEAFSTVRKVDTAAPHSLSSTFPWQALTFVLDQSIKALGVSAPMAENSRIDVPTRRCAAKIGHLAIGLEGTVLDFSR